jgi:hypothetical protein
VFAGFASKHTCFSPDYGITEIIRGFLFISEIEFRLPPGGKDAMACSRLAFHAAQDDRPGRYGE